MTATRLHSSILLQHSGTAERPTRLMSLGQILYADIIIMINILHHTSTVHKHRILHKRSKIIIKKYTIII